MYYSSQVIFLMLFAHIDVPKLKRV